MFFCAVCFRTGMVESLEVQGPSTSSHGPGEARLNLRSGPDAVTLRSADTATREVASEERYHLQCGHTFCTYCIANWCARASLRRLGGPGCPLCRRDISDVNTSELMDWKLLYDVKDIVTPMSDVTSEVED